MINSPTLTPELQQTAEVLLQNLLASEEFQAYHQARQALNSDSPARDLFERLSRLQTEVRHKQNVNTVIQVDIEELRAVQSQAQANNVIMDYAQCQQEAVTFLRQVNAEISQLLGVDCAALANQNTC